MLFVNDLLFEISHVLPLYIFLNTRKCFNWDADATQFNSELYFSYNSTNARKIRDCLICCCFDCGGPGVVEVLFFFLEEVQVLVDSNNNLFLF